MVTKLNFKHSAGIDDISGNIIKRFKNELIICLIRHIIKRINHTRQSSFKYENSTNPSEIQKRQKETNKSYRPISNLIQSYPNSWNGLSIIKLLSDLEA